MNGSEVNQNSYGGAREQSAREMTEEIDRATNLAVEEQDLAERKAKLGGVSMSAANEAQRGKNGDVSAGNFAPLQQGMSRERTVDLGSKVLTYNPEQVAREQQQTQRQGERVREMAEVENGLAGRAEENAGLVGMESALLSNEREELSRENMLNELDPKRDHEAEIMAKDQTGVAKAMAVKVEGMTRGNFKIMDLELVMSKGRDRMLEAFENPRRLGDRN